MVASSEDITHEGPSTRYGRVMAGVANELDLPDRLITRAVILFVVLGFIGLLAGGITAGLVMVDNQQRVGWVDHTYEVERHIDRLRLQIERLEAARRGYLLDEDPTFRLIFDDAETSLVHEIAQLHALTEDNPTQRANVERLTEQTTRLRVMLGASMVARTLGLTQKAMEDFRTDGSVQLARETRAVGVAMMAEENRLLSGRMVTQRRTVVAFYGVLIASGVLLLLVATASILLILRYVRALATSRDSLKSLNETLEQAVAVRTRDLLRANEEIQRFAYLVSHDLRSPLVNVLGFTAELEQSGQTIAALLQRVEEEAPHLLDAEARRAVYEDAPEALAFIRTSTQKMDRLINAILRLSREGRRTITPIRLDMERLVQAIADSMRHRLDEIGARLTVETPLPQVVSDRLAVEQILSNLIENAVKYLKPGRPGRIRVRGYVERGRAIFEVQDNGRGIDPKDHERVFELFRRAGPQDQPGEGIGLAHVRALAYRLGGGVTCQSALDEGAIFRLSLPVIYVPEPAA
ncbi:MAG: CHASE3 domain-containing protein [Caulobacteraceae bacterium]|nr:CHASE3 domain-containing protein [Caulobacteraceae bacterium]